jgi:hypothetical protein
VDEILPLESRMRGRQARAYAQYAPGSGFGRVAWTILACWRIELRPLKITGRPHLNECRSDLQSPGHPRSYSSLLQIRHQALIMAMFTLNTRQPLIQERLVQGRRVPSQSQPRQLRFEYVCLNRLAQLKIVFCLLHIT